MNLPDYKNIKIAFFDIDGTLWDASMRIPPSTAEAIGALRKNGHYAFLCSGRSKSNIKSPKLLSLGFEIQDQDLTEPGYMRHAGVHTIYTFSILLCDDEDFPVEQFRDMLAQYAAISPEIKPQFWGIEEYPAQMRNFTLTYVSVYV